MTDLIQRPSQLPDRADRAERSDRRAAQAVYWLYLAAPFSAGITGLVGVLMASGRRARAGATAASHFRFQTWTFGASAGAALTGGLWAALGGMATVADRTGGDLVLAGAALAATSGIGFMGASLFGLGKAASGDPIGRPG